MPPNQCPRVRRDLENSKSDLWNQEAVVEDYRGRSRDSRSASPACDVRRRDRRPRQDPERRGRRDTALHSADARSTEAGAAGRAFGHDRRQHPRHHAAADAHRAAALRCRRVGGQRGCGDSAAAAEHPGRRVPAHGHPRRGDRSDASRTGGTISARATTVRRRARRRYWSSFTAAATSSAASTPMTTCAS